MAISTIACLVLLSSSITSVGADSQNRPGSFGTGELTLATMSTSEKQVFEKEKGRLNDLLLSGESKLAKEIVDNYSGLWKEDMSFARLKIICNIQNKEGIMGIASVLLTGSNCELPFDLKIAVAFGLDNVESGWSVCNWSKNSIPQNLDPDLWVDREHLYMTKDHLTRDAAIVMARLLRKYPNASRECLAKAVKEEPKDQLANYCYGESVESISVSSAIKHYTTAIYGSNVKISNAAKLALKRLGY